MRAENTKSITPLSIITIVICSMISGICGTDDFNEPVVVSRDTAGSLHFFSQYASLDRTAAIQKFNTYRTNLKSDLFVNIPIQHSFELCKNKEVRKTASRNACNMVSYMLYLNQNNVNAIKNMGQADYTPYTKCYEFLVQNINSTDSIAVDLVYCPPVIFDLESDGLIKVERFFLGQGDHRMNSAFVYYFDNNQPGNIVNLDAYISDVFPMDTITISSKEYKEIVELNIRAVKARKEETESYFTRSFENSSASSAENKLLKNMCRVENAMTLCKYIAVNRFNLNFNEDDNGQQVQTKCSRIEAVLDRWDTVPIQYTIDLSGFHPFECIERKVGYFNTKKQKEIYNTNTTLYCPNQILNIQNEKAEFVNRNGVYHCPEFVLSPSVPQKQEMFVYDISKRLINGDESLEAIDVSHTVAWKDIPFLNHNNDDL